MCCRSRAPASWNSARSGRDPRYVADMGAEVVDHLQNNGIIAVAKHYPGIGRTVLDSHEDLPDLDLDPDVMRKTDLLPFQHVIQRQVEGIMLSHIRYRQLDPEWPASLSPQIAGDLLRREMGFQGLVLTDDLDMGAVAKHYRLEDMVRQCLAARVDIVLICHPGPKIEAAAKQIAALYRASETVAGDAGRFTPAHCFSQAALSGLIFSNASSSSSKTDVLSGNRHPHPMTGGSRPRGHGTPQQRS